VGGGPFVPPLPYFGSRTTIGVSLNSVIVFEAETPIAVTVRVNGFR
jgi:hypothetical protein